MQHFEDRLCPRHQNSQNWWQELRWSSKRCFTRHSATWRQHNSLIFQEIPRFLCNRKIHYRAYSGPPLFPVLSQINPVHVIASIFFQLLRSFQRIQVRCSVPCICLYVLHPRPVHKLEDNLLSAVLDGFHSYSEYLEAVFSIRRLGMRHCWCNENWHTCLLEIVCDVQ